MPRKQKLDRKELIDYVAALACECYGIGLDENDTPPPHPACLRTAQNIVIGIEAHQGVSLAPSGQPRPQKEARR